MSITIGQKIRDLREKENLSQQKLADIIGTTKGTIYKWERGENVPTVSTLRRLTDHPRFEKYSAWLLGVDYVAQQPPTHHVAEKFDKLPRAKQREVLDYMDFLLAQQDKGKT